MFASLPSDYTYSATPSRSELLSSSFSVGPKSTQHSRFSFHPPYRALILTSRPRYSQHRHCRHSTRRSTRKPTPNHPRALLVSLATVCLYCCRTSSAPCLRTTAASSPHRHVRTAMRRLALNCGVWRFHRMPIRESHFLFCSFAMSFTTTRILSLLRLFDQPTHCPLLMLIMEPVIRLLSCEAKKT
jgi:hypothetical protein